MSSKNALLILFITFVVSIFAGSGTEVKSQQSKAVEGAKVEALSVTPTEIIKTSPVITEIPTSTPLPTDVYIPPTSTPTPSVVTKIVQSDQLSNDNSYINSSGNEVHSPAYSNSVPSGATAICGDGSYSFSQSRRGTCSRHDGVAQWL